MIRTYSSRAGRLSNTNKGYLELSSKCLVELGHVPKSAKPCALDIGFGDAQSFSEDVLANQDIIFIGVEPYKKGFARAVEFYEKHLPKNLYLYNGCAIEYLKAAKQKFNFIRIHFPDPWPKKKHTKRRLISKEFLALLHKKIVKQGQVQIVTDSAIYQDHIEEVIKAQNRLVLVDTSFPISYKVSTFHNKGLKKGHTIKEYNLAIN